MKRWVLVALFALGCSQSSNRVIAGLHSAGAQVYLEGPNGERTLRVGAQLRASDQVKATGPAVIEFYKGAIYFLNGESVTIGEIPEARVLGATLPVERITSSGIKPVNGLSRLVAPRYADGSATPPSARPHELTNADYMRAFFTPNGIENLKGGPLPEGPREPLPPPPQRPRIPNIHAGDLGEGGAIIEVKEGFVAAETNDLATAVLRAGHRYALGQTDRILIPDGSGALLQTTRGNWALKGPLDLLLH
jgi:hypothetical protein